MIDSLKSRTKNILLNEVGSSNVEIIIWIAVVLLIYPAWLLLKHVIESWFSYQGYLFNEGVSTNYSW